MSWRIEQIELQNFLSYNELYLSLPSSGTFLLWGESGSGKTTLVGDAVAYALFGPALARGSQERLAGSGQDRPGKVVLRLTDDDERQLIISRSTQGEARLIELPGGQEVTGARAVTTRLIYLLGVDGNGFRNAFYAPQNQLSLLVDASKNERHKAILRLFGVDIIDRARAEASKARREAQVQLEALTQNSPSSIDHVEVERRLDDLLKQRRTKEQELSEYVVRRDTVVEEGRKAREQERILRNDVAAVNAELSLLRQRARTLEMTEQELADVREQLKRVRAEEDNHAVDINVSELMQLRQEVAELQARVEQRAYLKATIERKKTAARRVAERLEEQLQSEIAVLAERLRHLLDEQSIDVCPVCENPISAKGKGDGAAQTNGRKSKKTVLARVTSLDDPNVLRGQLQEIHSELSALEEELAKLGASGNGNTQQELAAQRERLQQLEQMVTRSAKLRERKSNLERQIERLEEKASTLRKSLNAPGATAESLEEKERLLQERLRAAQLDVERLLKEHQQLTDRIEKMTQEINQLKTEEYVLARDLQTYQRNRKALQKLEGALAITTQLEESLNNFRKAVVGSIYPALEYAASEAIYHISGETISRITISEAGEIVVEFTDGHVRPINLCSGGEKARVAIALRLALTSLVGNNARVGFLVLDEVFSAQDAGHREAILASLGKIRESYPQIFIVSHEGDMRDSPMIDWVIKTEKTESGSVASLL